MTDNRKLILTKHDISQSFNHAADTYDQAAFFQREVADRLLERLDYIRIDPRLILDLGAGTGYSSVQLEKRYKKAKVIVFDLAENMLIKGRTKHWFDRKRYICGDAEKLPFADQTMDLVFSNLMLHWTQDAEKAIREMQRVLKPDGLLLFSSLGPDTLYELRDSWAKIDSGPHVHEFLDMHYLGDYLQKASLKDAVVDMEFITLTYNDLKKVLLDLKDLGTHNIAKNRTKGLTGKEKFQKFIATYEKYRNPEGFIPVTYEVIYGLGWGQIKNDAPQEFSISIDSIQKRKT